MKKDVKVAGAYFNLCIKGDDFDMLNILAREHHLSTQEYLASIIEMSIRIEWNICMEELANQDR
jgi:hypothetical protein